MQFLQSVGYCSFSICYHEEMQIDTQSYGDMIFAFFICPSKKIKSTITCEGVRTERVTGRKARGLQMEEIGCKWQIFFFSLKWQEETN